MPLHRRRQEGADGDPNGLHTELLTPPRIAQAYTLAQFGNPTLTLDSWKALCLDPSGEAGALLVVCGRGYVRALCRFRAADHLCYGYTLFLSDIATGHPLDPARFAPLLLQRAEEHALTLGCRSMLVCIQTEADWLGKVLLGQGHHPEGITFAKRLSGTAVTAPGPAPSRYT